MSNNFQDNFNFDQFMQYPDNFNFDEFMQYPDPTPTQPTQPYPNGSNDFIAPPAPMMGDIEMANEDFEQALNDPDEWFWTMPAEMTLSSGVVVSGTYHELYVSHRELQGAILEIYNRFNNLEALDPTLAGAWSHAGTAPAVDPSAVTGMEGNGQNLSAVPGSSGQQEAQADGMEFTMTSNQPTTQQPAVPAPDSDRQPVEDAVPYVADIGGFAAAHSVLEGRDPSHCTKLDIPGDDFETIKSSAALHHWAGRFYKALQTPGITVGSPPITAVMQERFAGQQVTGFKQTQEKMESEGERKRARANCILAVEAAIFVHEHGIESKMFETAKKGKKSDRQNQVDFESKCSERLEKMVVAVRDYSRIKVDLVDGKGMAKFAINPDYYAFTKLSMSASNIIRQMGIDKVRQAAEDLEKKGKDPGFKFAAKKPTALQKLNKDGVSKSKAAGPPKKRGRPRKKPVVEASEDEAEMTEEEDEAGEAEEVQPRGSPRRSGRTTKKSYAHMDEPLEDEEMSEGAEEEVEQPPQSPRQSPQPVRKSNVRIDEADLIIDDE
ncbi:hypothetical protein KC318_g2811 [Hortaea werneckii]|nr:hypothetical protein KC334_g3194 [Hortaea werneckii]KAI7028007.1 hypothetical protein KC355_g137 [Hortaea werneckii]KAI7200965.1 hypothetical protein KC324_g2458 [Hortaea werneckii]KAI7588006.1 hypothetical protein KC316_g4701 [Hortaea werneckii]KAI7672531.1 hypothetical protein KC318_g2811 [Hortaea werneckii]